MDSPAREATSHQSELNDLRDYGEGFHKGGINLSQPWRNIVSPVGAWERIIKYEKRMGKREKGKDFNNECARFPSSLSLNNEKCYAYALWSLVITTQLKKIRQEYTTFGVGDRQDKYFFSGPQKSLLFLRVSLMPRVLRWRYFLDSLLGTFLLRKAIQFNGKDRDMANLRWTSHLLLCLGQVT